MKKEDVSGEVMIESEIVPTAVEIEVAVPSPDMA
jgi:hypothetical protein